MIAAIRRVELVELYALPSDLGWMAAVAVDGALAQLAFGGDTPQQAVRHLELPPGTDVSLDRRLPAWSRLLQSYAEGKHVDLRDIPLWLPTSLTAFQKRVLDLCREVSYGQMVTYGTLASRAGYERAARAVGNVMASNRIPLAIPCHRVVPAGGTLGRYSAAGGVRTKLRLLEMEGYSGRVLRERHTLALAR